LYRILTGRQLGLGEEVPHAESCGSD